MTRPYEYIKPDDFSFFDENDGFGDEPDLMGFAYDVGDSYGMVDLIVSDARRVLDGVDSVEARAMLWVGDMILDAVLESVNLVVNGKRKSRSEVDFQRVNQLQFIHLVVRMLARTQLSMGDDELKERTVEVTSARFCAAYCLRMVENSARDYLKWDGSSELRDYYLMQASAAYGLMKSLENSGESPIAEAVALEIRSQGSRDAAVARWKGDPKGRAMREIRTEWERRRRPGGSFAREMARHYQQKEIDLTEGGIKNAIGRWRREE